MDDRYKKVEPANKKPIDLADAFRLADEAARADVKNNNSRNLLQDALASLQQPKPIEAKESQPLPGKNPAATLPAKPDLPTSGKPAQTTPSNTVAHKDVKILDNKGSVKPTDGKQGDVPRAAVGTAHENLNVKTAMAASTFTIAPKSPSANLDAILRNVNAPKTPPSKDEPRATSDAAKTLKAELPPVDVKGVVPPANSDGAKAAANTAGKQEKPEVGKKKKGENTEGAEETSSSGASAGGKVLDSDGEQKLEAASSGISNGNEESPIQFFNVAAEGPSGEGLSQVLGKYALYRGILQPLTIGPDTVAMIEGNSGSEGKTDLDKQASVHRNARKNPYGMMEG